VAVATPAGAAAASRSRQQSKAVASSTETVGAEVSLSGTSGGQLTETGWVGGITSAGRSGITSSSEADDVLSKGRGVDGDPGSEGGAGGADATVSAEGSVGGGAGAGAGGAGGGMAAVAALGLGGSEAVSLRVVVEKNFKVYAYTRQEAHARLVALFATVEARLPNMVIARLTRGSCLRAYGLGITASLIASFLTANAHPSMLESAGGSIPENVED